MPINAATLNIGIGVTGEGAAAAAFQRVEKASQAVERRMGSATRSASNFAASMAQAGTVGATSLAGMAQQLAELAFGFGPAGPLIGAVATAGIAIGAIFLKAERDAEEFNKSLRRLLFDTSFAAASAQLHDLDFQIAEAQKRVQEANARTGASIEAILLKKQEQWKAERALNQLEEKRAKLVPVVQRLAVETGQRQAEILKIQQDQAAAAEREKAAQEAAARAIRDKAQAQKDMDAANAALAKASQGITLTGPTMDLGLGDLSHAPKVPVQIEPTFPDTAQAEWIAKIQDMAPGIQSAVQQTFGQAIEDGFTAGFTGKNPLAAFGKTILAGLGRIFMDMGKTLLGFGKIMAALQKFLLNPLTAGPAAIAAGVALIALGAALASIAGGTGGGGGAGGGSFGSNVGEVSAPAQVTNITVGASGTQRTAAGLTPQQPVNVTVIGPNDPAAQRGIVDLLDNARRRGLA